MRIPSLPFPQACSLARPRFLDLRSPREFRRDHVPGARNVPLFDDEQRAVVGFLYKQVSPEMALEEGLRIVEAKLSGLLERILGRPQAPETVALRFLEVARTL
ncbi:MAG: rhodanese-like domain-containing protein, partial [Planctomycetota bacterium]